MGEEISIEEKARAQGWVPQDEFNGEAERWKTAEAFVEAGEKIAPIQKERNEKLLSELQTIKKEMEEFKRIHFKSMKAAEKRAYEEAIKKLKNEQKAAVEEADIQRFEEIERQIATVQKPEMDEPAQTSTTQPPPEFAEWHRENEWYGVDQEMTEYADFIADRIKDTFPSTPKGYEKFLSEVASRAKKYAGKETKKPSSQVETPSNETSKPKTGTYKGLPQEAKQACDDMVKNGWLTQEEYVKEYYKEK